LTFRPLSKAFIRRSWYSIVLNRDTMTSHRVKKLFDVYLTCACIDRWTRGDKLSADNRDYTTLPQDHGVGQWTLENGKKELLLICIFPLLRVSQGFTLKIIRWARKGHIIFCAVEIDTLLILLCLNIVLYC